MIDPQYPASTRPWTAANAQFSRGHPLRLSRGFGRDASMQSGLGVQALTGSVVSRRLAARRPPGPRPSVTPRRYLLPLLPAGALWLALLASGASRADAGIVSAPGENLEISLITYGPGAIYWERFGHNSIEIRDEASGEAVSFNTR